MNSITNKYNFFKKAILVLCLLTSVMVSLILISGCGTTSTVDNDVREEIEPSNLSIVYSNRMNSAASPDEEILKPYIKSVLQSGGDISIVKADGSPKQVQFDLSNFKPSKKANDQNKNREDDLTVKKFISFLNESVTDSNKLKAIAPECDLIEAIASSSKLLPQKSDKKNYIIVIDSGISTSGRINLTNSSLLSGDLDFSNYSNLPNLKNVDKIIWCGFGATSDTQQPIPVSAPLYDQVQHLWENFVAASGVRGETKIEWLTNSAGFLPEARDGLPNVTNVEFAVDFNDDWKTIKFEDYQLRFIPDSAQFLDEKTAEEVLSVVANNIRFNNTKIIINGYIAYNGIETGTLSQDRADHVKQILIELGVSEENIQSVGRGAGSYPYMVNGVINGQNRYIEIVKA